MQTVLVTGANGFIGTHLVEALRRDEGRAVIAVDLDSTAERLDEALSVADVVFHLAGVNRPSDPAEFFAGNAQLTADICRTLAKLGRTPLLVLSSSIQAELDNAYGVSKREAELAVERWARDFSGKAIVFRLHNVFGKWCRPNYNSVTATFCHNIAHDLPIQISDADRELELIYIDDVIDTLLSVTSEPVAPATTHYRRVTPSHRLALGELADLIRGFRRSRETLQLPSFADAFTRRLYATYLSYLEVDAFGYALQQRVDARGSLAEFIKQPHFGQVFVSRTHPGVTRGNHYHHTKTEKFLVLEGDAVIRFRAIKGSEVVEYPVSGREYKVVDIPPGYTHSIENVGETELVTLFWASEVFDAARPDTFFDPVLKMPT